MTVLLALLLGVGLPGIAGGVLLTSFSPVPPRPGVLLGRVLSCGVAAWLLSSAWLARTVGITHTSSWITTGCLAALGLALLALPRSRAVLRVALPEVGYLASLLLVTALTWLPVGVLVMRTPGGLVGSTPWYYWGLADQIARAGRVPADATEWGTYAPFLDDYHLFSTGTAMLLTQDPSSLRALQGVILLAVVLLACGAALLAGSFGAGRVASLAAVPVAIATGVGAVKMSSYRPEAFALGLALLLVALYVDWLRHGERGSLVAACLLAAVLSQVHGIALVTAGVFLTASTLALLPRDGTLRFLRRCALSGGALAAGCLLLALTLGGAASGTGHAGRISDTSGLADPTWEFVRAIKGLPPSVPPTNQELATSAVSGAYSTTGWWVGPVVAAATILLLLGARRRPVARQVLVFTLLSLVGVAAVAAVFAFGWSSYVPRRTGDQRLTQEATLLAGPFVACGLACLPFRRIRLTRRRVVPVITVLALCAGGLVETSRIAEAVARQRPAPTDQQGLAGLEIPADAVMLSNAYTEGYIAQVTGARGLLEGRAPYTFPGVLARANALLREAQAFYAAPRRRLDFLERNDVSYVLVSERRSFSVGTDNVFAPRVRTRLLDTSPALTRVLSTPGLVVYRVRNTVPASTARDDGSSTPNAHPPV
jgi:hypothetical protein